ncbi:leucine-rich repeat domain-containing protein [Candidatus Enterococcus courvalinii]|uniref:Leucine-rich repeat domain-containing protein n=1 Tax=Candidatus Enterococcus courvalinii TaxID=2815329 RepID=A0ABS3I2W3_9ENTE|nr:leucine-rich repeat domain-containing protein [Enterococcus sp. MSG2901]MBO0483049.1 leucine-rich repeat domain-containing protein [Enterococcus sp. MSG2901]
MKRKLFFTVASLVLFSTALGTFSPISYANENVPQQEQTIKVSNYFTDTLAPLKENQIDSQLAAKSTQTITINDPAFESKLKEIFHLTTDEPITSQHMESLVTLDISGLSIKDITGIEFALNLTDFRLNNNLVTDLTPIQNLTKLRIIGATNNGISSIDTMNHLPALEQLALSNNQLTSLDGVSKFPTIKQLWVDNNQLSSLVDLYYINDLRMINFNFNNIIDLAPLKKHTKLQGIYGAENKIQRVDTQLDFPNLVALELSENRLSLPGNNFPQIENLRKIAEFKNLQQLGLSSNELNDISPLVELPNLKHLTLSGNELTSLEVLEDIPSLQKVVAFNQTVSGSNTWTNHKTPLKLRTIHGERPNVTFNQPGTYDGTNVSWLEAGTNNLSWSFSNANSSEQFSGIYIQYAAPDWNNPTTPRNLKVQKYEHFGTILSWDASTDDSGIRHYEYYRDDRLITTTTDTSYCDYQINGPGQWKIKVRAVDFTGKISDYSEELFFSRWF